MDSSVTVSERIWSEPLTENEREIIENVLATGSVDDLRRWLRHVVKVYDATEEATRG